MLDMAGILFSSLMILVVISRAVRLDRSRPWFQTIEPRVKDIASDIAPEWRRKT